MSQLLYQHIYELKRTINLFDKEEMRIDQVKLEFAELFTDFIKSSDYNKLFKENFEKITELFVNFKKDSISFPTLVKNLFEILEWKISGSDRLIVKVFWNIFPQVAQWV